MKRNPWARITTLSAALVLGLSAVASATDLWGGPLSPETGPQASAGAFLRCEIVNLGDNPIDVTMEIFDRSGKSLTGPIAFPPLGTRAATDLAILADFNLGRLPRTCKFSGSFSKNKVRAAATVFVPAENGTIAVVEAR
jgi:hypothetical protein